MRRILLSLGAVYLAAQVVGAVVLPGLSALVFGDLLPRLWAALG